MDSVLMLRKQLFPLDGTDKLKSILMNIQLTDDTVRCDSVPSFAFFTSEFARLLSTSYFQLVYSEEKMNQPDLSSYYHLF